MMSLVFLLKFGATIFAAASQALQSVILPTLGVRDSSNRGGSKSVSGGADGQLLTDDQLQAFQRDGYLVLKGLLSDQELDQITRAADAIVAKHHKGKEHTPFYTFSVLEKGMIFAAPQAPPPENDGNGKNVTTATTTEKEYMDATEIVQAFRRVAIQSKLKQVAAELMQLDPSSQNVRILRDVFLAKPIDTDQLCDWHVDDVGFWPAQFRSQATETSGKDQDGINVWLALDDMPAKYEGSMAVAPGSHVGEWRHEAYKAIGQDRSKDITFDVNKFANMISQTCIMDQSNPELREKLEASKVVIDLERGDAIFATRLLFHRVLEVTPEGKEYYTSKNKPTLNRYSIRYTPGTTRLPKGHNVLEWSMILNEKNMGSTLDEIVTNGDGLVWYPQVWPTVESRIDEKLDQVGMQVPKAKVEVLKERAALSNAIQALKEKNVKH